MPDQDRRRSWPNRLAGAFALLAIVLALAAGITAAVLRLDLGLLWRPDEERALAIERAKRRLYWSAGLPLPGTPDLGRLPERLAGKGMSLGSPVLMRVFKREFELEVWLRKGGRFEHFATYPVCRFSGRLGPKLRTGDKQAPEGFYTVTAGQLNPQSRWHRSFNLGFPNAYDRAHGRTGSFLMVHGGCSSVGCYAMTNAVMDEIWTLVTSALAGGQRRFQVQAYPFRMTEEHLAAVAASRDAAFWRSLKRGHDLFLASGVPPRVQVCDGDYVFSPAALPAAATAGPISACAKRQERARSQRTSRAASR